MSDYQSAMGFDNLGGLITHCCRCALTCRHVDLAPQVQRPPGVALRRGAAVGGIVAIYRPASCQAGAALAALRGDGCGDGGGGWLRYGGANDCGWEEGKGRAGGRVGKQRRGAGALASTSCEEAGRLATHTAAAARSTPA